MNKSSQKKLRSASSKVNVVKLGSAPPSSSSSAPVSKRLDPLTAFAKHSTQPPGSQSSSQIIHKNNKGKGKATETGRKTGGVDSAREADARLWVDIYEPRTEADLAVHIRKVEDVRKWFTEALVGGISGNLRKYRRILVLTGPAGTGKTTTVRVLARELGFEIMEWRNAMGEGSSNNFMNDASGASYSSEGQSFSEEYEYDPGYEALYTKFEVFLNRATNCQSIFSQTSSIRSENPASHKSSPEELASTSVLKRHIVLLEDLPNILHPQTQAQFHASLEALVRSAPANPAVPVVIIISDTGIRGEVGDERLGSGENWKSEKNQVVDIRTALPKDLLNGPYVTQISFNPIAPTLLRKAIQNLLKTHMASSHSKYTTVPSKEITDMIVESSNGDIRSAVMALQFACVLKLPSQSRKSRASTLILEAVTRREQSLFLFHMLGKVLYNKRKGDPSSSSASAKDIQRERDIDAQLSDPPDLPEHLEQHARRTSRVDVDALYANSPIDSSLFSLYIHQNYTQFCNTVDECENVSEWMSSVDSSGGEAWYQANPHRFHLLAMGTLHSLPSPVSRRSQKYYKPEFFDVLQKEKHAWDAVADVKDWLHSTETRETTWNVGGWSKTDIALELGRILDLKRCTGVESRKIPISHLRFSRFSSRIEDERLQHLKEGDTSVEDGSQSYEDWAVRHTVDDSETQSGGWLDDDDIEEC